MRPPGRISHFQFQGSYKKSKKGRAFSKKGSPFSRKGPLHFCKIPKIETAFHFGGLEPLLKLIIDSGPSPWSGQRIQEEPQLVPYPIPQKERRQNFMHGKDVGEGVTITRAMLGSALYKAPILVTPSPQGLPYTPHLLGTFFPY